MTLDYLHFENALRFKHVELCGVRVHRPVLTLYIGDYSSVETRSHCLAFHVFSLSHYRVPTGGPDQRVPEDNTTPLALSVFAVVLLSEFSETLACHDVSEYYPLHPAGQGFNWIICSTGNDLPRSRLRYLLKDIIVNESSSAVHYRDFWRSELHIHFTTVNLFLTDRYCLKLACSPPTRGDKSICISKSSSLSGSVLTRKADTWWR